MTHRSGETNRQTATAAITPATTDTPAEAVHFEKERGVTEIRILQGVAHVTVTLAEKDLGSGRLEVLQSLAGNSVPVFLVKLLPNGLSFAIRGENIDACSVALKQTGSTYKLKPDLAVVSTIAGAMRDLSGIMAAIYEALNEAGIRVQQTGDAYNAVLCLVTGSFAEQAVQVLRKQFTLDDSGDSKADTARETEVPGTGLKAL